MNYPLFLRKTFAFSFVFFYLSTVLHAGGGKEREPLRDGVIIASTSWAAALARCGGAQNIRVLAPADLRHPPEYELKPSDLNAASKASLIIYSGWEMFAKKLAETAGSAGVRILQIELTNDPVEVKGEAKRIAELLGTTEKYDTWAAGFDACLEDIRSSIFEAYAGKRIVVNRMQTPFVKWLGLEITGEYGPAEPSPALILELVNTKPAIVIDNYHSPSGMPIAEAAHVPYIELINFPGKGGTETIEDVFLHNADMLVKAARQ
ncbi:MAG: metal ABC transporter substrate-binding protein [Spirochaetaceae bacterium]|nr:metal ABC transporter substrate-binding protein [Spirochaetaceae bacterium]